MVALPPLAAQGIEQVAKLFHRNHARIWVLAKPDRERLRKSRSPNRLNRISICVKDTFFHFLYPEVLWANIAAVILRLLIQPDNVFDQELQIGWLVFVETDLAIAKPLALFQSPPILGVVEYERSRCQPTADQVPDGEDADKTLLAPARIGPANTMVHQVALGA